MMDGDSDLATCGQHPTASPSLQLRGCIHYADYVAIHFKLYDTETKREVTGSAEFVVLVADATPMVVGPAPASRLYTSLLGLAEAMVAKVGPVRIPISRRWQAVHVAIAELRAADRGVAPGVRPPLNATDVIRLVGEKFGAAAQRDIQEAVFERVSGRVPE